jgi:ABC-2 type transport system ATP-binding protein
LETISTGCSLLETQTSPIGINKAKIHIANDSDVRNVIAVLNENVELRSFSEVIPTMNDIFIRAVEHNV